MTNGSRSYLKGGLTEIHELAVERNHTDFKNFKDSAIFNQAYAVHVGEMIVSDEYRGIAMSSYDPTKPIKKEFVQAVVAYAKERHLLVLFEPSNNDLTTVPDFFFNTPEIHILTSQVIVPGLELTNFPVTATLVNPLTKLEGGGPEIKQPPSGDCASSFDDACDCDERSECSPPTRFYNGNCFGGHLHIAHRPLCGSQSIRSRLPAQPRISGSRKTRHGIRSARSRSAGTKDPTPN